MPDAQYQYLVQTVQRLEKEQIRLERELTDTKTRVSDLERHVALGGLTGGRGGGAAPPDFKGGGGRRPGEGAESDYREAKERPAPDRRCSRERPDRRESKDLPRDTLGARSDRAEEGAREGTGSAVLSQEERDKITQRCLDALSDRGVDERCLDYWKSHPEAHPDMVDQVEDQLVPPGRDPHRPETPYWMASLKKHLDNVRFGKGKGGKGGKARDTYWDKGGGTYGTKGRSKEPWSKEPWSLWNKGWPARGKGGGSAARDGSRSGSPGSRDYRDDPNRPGRSRSREPFSDRRRKSRSSESRARSHR